MCQQSLSLTPDAQLEFARLPREAREEVQRWFTVLRPIAQALANGEPKVATLKRAARMSGIKFGTLKRKWYEVTGPRGWEALVDRAKFPLDRAAGLPSAFRTWVRSLYFEHTRNQTGQEVHRKVCMQWRAWRKGDISQAIPGYMVPPPPEEHTHLPAGWSKSNIAKLKPSKYALRTRREGTRAAKELLPHILRTRVGLEFGQLFQIDDQDYDVYVNFERNRKAMRPAGFNALEVLSACHFSHVAKPLIYKPEDGTRSRLSERDCHWHTLAWLWEFGYRADIGTTITAEMGTASLERIKAALHEQTEEKITVQTSGIMGEALFKGLVFDGATGGNFRMKAHIESSFALVRTMMAHLRGATGSYHSTGVLPAENHTLLKYNEKVLGWAAKLPKARADLFLKPVLSWAEFGQARLVLMELMNHREWHTLEGWAECGFVETVVHPDPRDPDHYLTYAQIMEMPEGDRDHFLRLMTQPRFARPRRMSPREVFEQNKDKLTKLTPHKWHLILPNDYADNVVVQPNHTLRVKSQAPGGEALIYMARLTNAHGRTELVSPGDRLRVYANPFAPDLALVCTEADQAIGLAPLIPRTCVIDGDGALRSHANIRRFKAELDTEARAHAEGLAAQRQHMLKHNQAIMDGAPITEAEHESTERMEDAGHAADAALDAAGEREGVGMPMPVLSKGADEEEDPLDQ